MKYKTLVFVVGICLLASPAIGQRLKDKRAQVTYVSLPTQKLPDSYTTYSVAVYGSAIVEGGSNSEALANRITMDGFKRVNHQDGGGHIRVVVNTGGIVQGRPELKSKKNTSKDPKTGQEKVTWEYWYEIPFNAGPTFQIYDPDGNILDSGGRSSSQVKKTRSYANSTDLSKNYSNLLNGLRKDFAREVSDGITGQVRMSLSRKFDFNKTSDNPEFFIIDNYEKAADYEKYFNQIDTEWKSMDAATPTSDLKSKFGPALAFYEKEAALDPKDDKKLVKVFEAANYNAALLSYYLDDFEKAVRYANRVIAQEGGKHKKSSDLIEKVQETKKLMDLHGIQTLHYARDLSNAMAPSAIKALEMAQQELETANNLLRGAILVNGERIEGTVINTKGTDELDFSDQGNTKFLVEDKGSKKEYSLSAKEIEAFSIGDRNFVKTNFAPCAKGKSEAAMHIMEEVYASDKIALYKYYPSAGALSDAKTEYAFKKASDPMPVSLYDTRFLILKKGLANYFADCADLKTMCENGEIQNEKDSLLQAARIYAEVCN